MKPRFSLLLTGLTQRLLLATIVLIALWSVYAWAVASPNDLSQPETPTQTEVQ
ncbi:hypothetical protein ACNR0F_10630 [Kingella kingae]|uniref:hypothetical protein n=1 Tax=Kingella kingae TaxID=504 RepID=UPI003AB15565